MNTPLLHEGLCRLRDSAPPPAGPEDVYNGYEVPDPFSAIDCDPNTNYGNFEMVMEGDVLVYAEIANSTPNDGRRVLDGFEHLVNLTGRTSCVFGNTDIRRMRKCVVGTDICTAHMCGTLCGSVVDASVLNGACGGERYCTLCVLAWIGRKYVEHRMNPAGMLYLSFGIFIASETCCQCGRTGFNKPPCRHVEKNGAGLPGMSICRFKSFDVIALEE